MRQMAYLASSRSPAGMPPRQINWRGRSGRLYALTTERLDSFVLTTDGLHMLARGTLPLWVGTAYDVIHDAASRARFRLALAAAVLWGSHALHDTFSVIRWRSAGIDYFTVSALWS